jgi:cholesterol oxidase
LYVADGSIIPTALGVNPYMTIGALAERIANHIVHNPIHADLFDGEKAGRS